MKYLRITRTSLIVILTGLLLFSFTLTSLLSFNLTREMLTSNVRNETLPLISDSIYSKIQEDLINPINNSSLMANDEFLVKWVTDGEKNENEVVQYLRRIKEKYGYFSAFYVSEISGNYYYYDGILKQISPQDDHDVWYYKFRSLNREYDLDVDTDEATNGTVTIFINHRLEDNAGNFLGVTGVGLEMDSIGQTLAEYRQRFGHEIFMTDASGLIQVHANPHLIETTYLEELPGFSELSDDILADREGTDIYEFHNEHGDVVLSARYFPDFDWYLIVEQDQNVHLQPAREKLMLNILIGFLVTLLVIAIVAWILSRYNRQLEELADSDALTGLYNRRKFDELFAREISLANRYEQPLSLLMIDIDYFKGVNDLFGHQVGDELLLEITKVLKSGIRESDIIARWGGEEFVILLHQTAPSEGVVIAERLRMAVEGLQIDHKKGIVSATISVGVAGQAGGHAEMDTLFLQADAALLQAKSAGRNRVFSSD